MEATDRITVVGAGAIGGTIAAYLARAGVPVRLVDANVQHVAAIRQDGLHIKAYNEEFSVHVSADTPDSYQAGLGRVLLATKAPHTADAVTWIAPRLARDGWVLSTQNGLNEMTIAQAVGEDRTIGCFINFFADVIEPGVIHYGGPGTFAIGELNGSITERLRGMENHLQPFISPIVTENIWGYLWSKLAYGAILFATALTDETMADCVDHPRYRAALRELGREVVGLARRQGIGLEPFDGWDPNALEEQSTCDSMFDGVSRMMRGNLKVRSGVWRDLAVHHRKTEVDPQYGPVLDIAQNLEYPMPKLTALVNLIHALEDGRNIRSLDNLEVLLEA